MAAPAFRSRRIVGKRIGAAIQGSGADSGVVDHVGVDSPHNHNTMTASESELDSDSKITSESGPTSLSSSLSGDSSSSTITLSSSSSSTMLSSSSSSSNSTTLSSSNSTMLSSSTSSSNTTPSSSSSSSSSSSNTTTLNWGKQEKSRPSLFAERAELEAAAEREPVDELKAIELEEAAVMAQLEQGKDLKGAWERAAGLTYSQALPSPWRPTRYLQSLGDERCRWIRAQIGIDVDGEAVPPPILRFADARLPAGFMQLLADKGIREPSPIQMQAIPAGLARRDVIGISYTGSGKTLAFVVPLLAHAALAEHRLPLIGGEGPVGLVLTPSRELARQIFELIGDFAAAHLAATTSSGSGVQLRSTLCIGGLDMREQLDAYRSNGLHVVVATPGRVLDLLKQGAINLASCGTLVLDEADRLLSDGFEDDIRGILSFFHCQRQTLLFSATMPRQIQLFARSALVQPLVINVGKAGAASLCIRQDVELVPDDAKLAQLLEALQKTAPPVLIFTENKSDADSIHEFLLVKDVDAVAIHGGLFQDERDDAIARFRAGLADVLVATDVVSKGLDFPNIEHVINYDMPDTIENYIHRIGRTGRFGKSGIATTFISPTQTSTTTLLDLRHLLHEARQRIPKFLHSLRGSEYAALSIGGIVGCAFCGGRGHRVSHCDKLERHQRALLARISSTGSI